MSFFKFSGLFFVALAAAQASSIYASFDNTSGGSLSIQIGSIGVSYFNQNMALIGTPYCGSIGECDFSASGTAVFSPSRILQWDGGLYGLQVAASLGGSIMAGNFNGSSVMWSGGTVTMTGSYTVRDRQTSAIVASGTFSESGTARASYTQQGRQIYESVNYDLTADATVPEPATWMLGVAGLGLLYFARSRA